MHTTFCVEFCGNRQDARERCDITEATFQEDMNEAWREVRENPGRLQQHMDEAELANTQSDGPALPASVAGSVIVARASSRSASLCEHALAALVSLSGCTGSNEAGIVVTSNPNHSSDTWSLSIVRLSA